MLKSMFKGMESRERGRPWKRAGVRSKPSSPSGNRAALAFGNDRIVGNQSTMGPNPSIVEPLRASGNTLAPPLKKHTERTPPSNTVPLPARSGQLHPAEGGKEPEGGSPPLSVLTSSSVSSHM